MRITTCRLGLLVAPLLAIVSAACSSSSGTASAASSEAFDPTQSHYGKTASEWGVEWFKYVFQLPQTDPKNCIIPYSDPTGQNCGYGQSGDVFFLAGTQGGAVVRNKCVIPVGKAILVPIANAEADNAGLPAAMQQTAAMMQAYVKSQLDGVTKMTFTIDGTSLPNLQSYRTQVTMFSYTEPAEPNFYTCNAVTGVTGVITPAYGAGYYVLLTPPTVGAHTLHFTADSPNSMPPFTLDVTYNFTVQ